MEYQTRIGGQKYPHLSWVICCASLLSLSHDGAHDPVCTSSLSDSLLDVSGHIDIPRTGLQTVLNVMRLQQPGSSAAWDFSSLGPVDESHYILLGPWHDVLEGNLLIPGRQIG